MIHTNRIVTVGEQECIIDRPIVLYRGDREVEIEFTLVGNEFTFSDEGNVIKSVNASHGQLVLNTPSGEHMFSELAECHEGKVVFVVTKEMIDEFIEMGFYSFQIRLYDSAEMKSRVTIPPVMNGFDIRNPIAAEDETNVVDQGIVDYARIFKDQSNEELPTFTWDGEYVKTEWAHHDVITENKMNKIEDALYSINANIKESDVVMLNALDNVKKDADKYVKEHMAEVEQDVEDFERNLNTGVERFKIDTNAAMTTHKNEVSEELESVNSQLADNKKKSYIVRERLEGETNDNEAIKEAIEKSHENATIYFTRDVYISEKIYVSDRIIDGGNNTFYCAAQGLDYQFNAGGEVKFINCKVDSGLIGRGFVTVSNSDMFIAENLHFTGYSKEFGYYKTDSGIILNSNVKKANIKNCVWNNWGNQYGTETTDLNRCITVNDSVDDVVVEGCSFINVNQAIVNAGKNLRAINNTFKEVNDNGFYLFGKNTFIQNNVFMNMNDEVIVLSGGNYFISNNTFNNWKNKAIAFCGNVDFIHIHNNTLLSSYDNSQFIITRDTDQTINKLLIDNNIFQCDYAVTNSNDWFTLGTIDELRFNDNIVSVNHTSTSKKLISSMATIVRLFNNSFVSKNVSEVNVISNNKEGHTLQHENNYVSKCRINVGGNKMGKVQDNVAYYTGVNANKFVYCGAKPTWTSQMKKGDIILKTTIDTDSKNSDILGWYFDGSKLVVIPSGPIVKEGSPVNSKRPRYIGDICIDTLNKKVYVATTGSIDGWIVLN